MNKNTNRDIKRRLNLFHFTVLIAGLFLIMGLIGCAGGGADKPGTDSSGVRNLDYLDPQMSWPYNPGKFAGAKGKFYLMGQNEGFITVFDADTQKKISVINIWDYERALLKKAGKKLDKKAEDFLMKNKRPHHGWVVPGGRYLYVSNNAKKSDQFWVVDTKTDKIITHFNTGGMGPLHGAFSPFRDLAVFGNVQDREKGVATFIDTKNHKVITTVATSGNRTRDVVFTPDNKHIYITNQGWNPDKGNKGGVDMINIDTYKIVKTFPIQGSKGMKITYDGSLVGVTGFPVGEVTFIDPVKHEIIGTVKTGGQPNNISFHPDGTRAYVGLYKSNNFTVIDIKALKVKTTIPGGKQANAVYFAPGSKQIAFGTNEKDTFVTVIDTETDEKVAEIETPLGSHNVAFTPDGKTAIISCKRSREAVFVDVATLEQIAVIDKAGFGNNGVRWVPYIK